MTKREKLILIGAVLGIGGVTAAAIIFTRKVTRQQKDIYVKLKEVIKIMCKCDDYIDQKDLFTSQDMIADILCKLESKYGKKNELCELVPWLFVPD